MSIESRAKEAVASFAPFWTEESWDGSEDTKSGTYLTFNATSMPHVFADGEVPYERYICQLHLYCPRATNTVKMRKQIKKALYAAGFTWPHVEPAHDGDGGHYVFEFQGLESTGEAEDGEPDN